jgi:cell division septum initiation protein DivIVA
MALQDARVGEALGRVATRLEAVLESNRRLEVEVAELRAEVAGLRALPASERPATVGAGQRLGESPGEALGEAQGSSDGPMVRAARWLERRLRGNRV